MKDTLRFDNNLDIKKPALEVLKHLRKIKISGERALMLRTAAWYNGRERGISVSVSTPNGRGLVVVFSENRNSDDIVVYTWHVDFAGTNPVTPDQMSDATYRAGKYFAENSPELVAKYVANLIKSFLQ